MVRPPVFLSAVALILVVLAGGLCLAMPFSGDQAYFAVYGRELTRGAVLYREVFDIKQPGIFWFYSLGGSLFGFTEVGIHLFELIYWLAFSVFVSVALRPYFATRWGAPLVPVFAVVVYYLYAGLLDLTQIEILVAFPLLLAWWLIDQAEPATRRGFRRYAAAGLAAAAVVLLKHVYVLIVLTFLAYSLIRAQRRGATTPDIRRAVGAFGVGLIVPLLTVAIYFAAYGQLGRIWWATFELGPAAQVITERPLSYLKWGIRRFLIGYGPIVILAVLGCVGVLRERTGPTWRLVAGMVIWCVVGGVAFMLQGWFEHKWMLFTVPLGILALVGLERLVAAARALSKEARLVGMAAGMLLGVLAFVAGAPAPQTQTKLLLSVVIGCCAGIVAELSSRRPQIRRPMALVLVVALGVSIGTAAIVPAEKIGRLAKDEFAVTADARADLRRSWSQFYADADQDLGAVGRLPAGPFQVFGRGELMLRSDRSPAVPYVALRPEFYDQRVWREVLAGLRTSPPIYVVVDFHIGEVIASRHPPMIEFIHSWYRVAFIGASGTWYVRRDVPASFPDVE
jgi:Dolichyl-phosphate-mannose-protein mannosyltransferase